ncbi:MAG: ATP-binding protein [Candidatus Promineifilaceae bacterium]
MSESKTIKSLTPEQLRRVCNPLHFDFETTAEVATIASIIGQPRGTRAIEFGITIDSYGYNIYVLGETGTGRTTAIRRFLEERAETQSRPDDWVYVYNFSTPHRPRAIQLPAGEGARFKNNMAELLSHLLDALPKAFDSEDYETSVHQIRDRVQKEQDTLLNDLREQAAKNNFALINTASGLVLAPMQESKVMPPEQFDLLPAEQRQALLQEQQGLNDLLDDALEKIYVLDSAARIEIAALDRNIADTAVSHYFQEWIATYQDNPTVLLYLSEMRVDVLEHLNDFVPDEESDSQQERDLTRYGVNLLVDNHQTQGAPVIVESNPTYFNLIGRIEYESQFGAMVTHMMNLKAGSLHRANGGYLILNARDILRHPLAWEALKRAIVAREIQMQSPDSLDGQMMLAKSLDPEPIPLSVKIILLGSPGLYYALYDEEEDFGELFKVKADFDSVMPRDNEHEFEYARFVANRCQEEGLRHFDREAVEKIVEYGSRVSGHQLKLSTRFGEIADLIREADYWAGLEKREIITAVDVRKALEERRYRANLVEEHFQEQIHEGTVFIDTTGVMVGQVNGLSIIDLGDYAFGQPSRVTARTYMGEEGLVNIEREVEMAGPIHNKGMMILTGYLGGRYAQNQPLSMSASLTFEQNYGGIEGDSASSTELYALLSSLSGIPIKQSIAVTGSVNQRGEIQPIGGVTEKIEGFFDICLTQGLTGEQGVIIPEANVKHLMLREDVVETVANGRFHIWAVSTVDDGIELLTGVPAGQKDKNGSFPEGTVHYAVQTRLLALAEELKSFGEKEDNS